MCIPNKELTVLLEFCYNEPKIIIPKGNKSGNQGVPIIQIQI